MRIVMLTDDVEIDRRILLEAKTLIEHGNEVILLAGWAEGKPSNEVVGEIKIERQLIPDFGKVDILIVRAQNRFVGVLNKVSIGVQDIFCRTIVFVNTSISNPSRSKVEIDRLLYCRNLLQSGLPVILEGITAVAMCGNKVADFSRRVLAEIRQLPLREEFLLKRTVYFNPDIIHVHDLPLLRVGALAKRKLKVPLIYDAHEFYPEQPRLTVKERNYLRRLEKKYIYEADQVITVNPLLAREMEKHYHGISIGVVQNAISPDPEVDALEVHDRFRAEYPIKKDSIILLYQGWISTGRNLETIIRGMKNVDPRFILLIMGYGDYKDHLMELVEQESLADKVMFIPSKNQEELLQYSASADIGLIPYPYGRDLNTHLVSPNKLYEFISAKLPILSNDLPFVKSVLEENGFGICADIQTEEGFSETFNGFPVDKLKEFKENIKKNKRLFEWEHESKVLIKYYENLLPERKFEALETIA